MVIYNALPTKEYERILMRYFSFGRHLEELHWRETASQIQRDAVTTKVKEKVERESLTLKANKESSDEECSTSGSEDEEYAMANGKSDRKCFRCGDLNHLIEECPKPSKDKNQRTFVRVSWSGSGEEDDEKVTKLGLGFNSFEASSSGTKEIKFVKAQKKASSDEVEHSPQAVAKCAVHDDGTRPVHGRNDTRVNDLNSHTNDEPVEHVISSAVCLPMEAIDEIKARFVNTLYGFPVGKRLAFPMVENYVKYAWAKYGLKRVMMHHGFFMFQFDSDSGMVKVMEDGPWRIQLVPIILNVWRPNTLLQKDKVTHVSLWLKMHNVPIVAYSKVGLDLISAKVGRLMRLDAHTNFICLNSWGRSDYARALVEVSADKPLVDSVDIDIPREDGNGYTTANIRIEFEWQPPRCGTCKIFDHLDSVCPIKRVAGPSKQSDMQADEKKDKQLVQATGKKGKGKQVGNQRYIKGYRVNIPKSKLVYRAVVKPQGDKNVASNMGQSLDTTKKPSPSDSSMNGMSSFINDDINLEELRNFVDKSMQEGSVLEQVGNYDINGCTSREKQGEKVSSKKSSLSLEILNEDLDTDVDEVFVPKVRTTFPSSSGGGGHQLEEDAYDDYEDQFEDYPSLHQEFCDQFDFKHREVLESGEGSIYKGGDKVVGGVGLGLKGDDKVLGLELKGASKVVHHGGGWFLGYNDARAYGTR
ncbi:zinc knuckle CX2CX4HX4C containing protein [Tanacetum coccineum]